MTQASSDAEEALEAKKQRKPYVITRQREAWQPDEHERFLEV